MRGSRRIPATAALVAAVVVVVGLVTASAAQLNVGAGQLSAADVGHSCPGTATGFPADRQTGRTFRSVMVKVPAGCESDAVGVAVVRPTGTPRTGTGTADATGAATILLDSTYDVGAANTLRVTADGWEVPAQWAHVWCTVVGSTGATCSATVSIFTGVKPGGSAAATYYDVVVTTTSTSYVQWEVGLYLNQPFYGTQATRLGNSTVDTYNDGATAWNGTANNATRVSACSALPVLALRGANTGGANTFRDVRNDRERRFSLVVNQTQAGYFDVISPGCT